MLALTSIPPILYEDVVHEQDLMFFNFRLIGFYSLCILVYFSGTATIRFVPPRFTVLRARMSELRPNLGAMIWLPLGAAFAVGLLTCVLLLKSNPALLALIMSGQGQEAKSKLDMSGNLGGMGAFVAAVLAYTQMRLYQCERAVKPMVLLACKSLWWATFALAIMTALLKLARYEAIPVVLSFMIIWLRTRASGRPAAFAIGWGAVGLGGVLTLFSLVALVRGAEAFQSLMGYGPASFNHLAAVLSGRLQYKGTIEPGVYTLNFINNLPFIHRLTDAQFFNFDAAADFKNEFDVAAGAGLNRHLIWITAFGYYFVDMGWWSLLLHFVAGVFTGVCWKSFNSQKAWGSVMYPFLASTMLLWPTGAMLTRPPLTISVLSALLLMAWDRLPLWKQGPPQQVRSIARNAN